MAEARLDVGPEHLAIVRGILLRHFPDREVWAFGSRVRGTAKPWSDLDLVLLGDRLPGLRDEGLLREAFEESDLPWKVDVVWWATASPAFREIIQRDHAVVQAPAQRAA